MLKKLIKYKNFNDEQMEEVFFFNISSAEAIEMAATEREDMARAIRIITESKDPGEIVNQFKKWILISYGEKTDDGKSFLKGPELSHKFSQTAAFDALFMELATDAKAGAEFFNGILPAGLLEQLSGLSDQDKPTGEAPRPLSVTNPPPDPGLTEKSGYPPPPPPAA